MNERSLFAAALDIADPLARAAYLDAACGGDAALRRHLDDLLSAEERLGNFLASPPGLADATTDHALVAEGPGSVVGPYKLMEQIGEGGFGLVFVAEQQEPVRRKVALKIVKPGMDTREVVARFEAERQALALMDHPNIAHIFDGGTTASGRPFFVMELVRGVPITDYCDQQHLTTRERLELFVAVCQAVQHAHGKGIIHRDLKPANVLVSPHDGVPVVKVIDFGIAKVLGQRLTDKTIYTRFAQLLGTPLYMSPEQAELNALDVDTRSDVYSLGVLLYELLTGTTPFDRQRFAAAAFDEIRRIIREEEPPKPSTRLSTMGDSLAKVSTQRKSDAARLPAQVRGDLDWIVMKALDKDRTRRYETASGFAADVRRYLGEEPIEARPPSTWYRFGKLVRRHRGPLVAAAGFALLLVAGAAVATWQAIRATEAEQRARMESAAAVDQRLEAEAARNDARAASAAAQRVSDYLFQDMLAAFAGDPAQLRSLTVEQLLRRASANLGRRFGQDPQLEATLRLTVGRAFQNLTLLDDAEGHLRAAVALRRQALGDDHPDTHAAATGLAGLLCVKGAFAEAEGLARTAWEGLRRHRGDDHDQTLTAASTLVWATNHLGRRDESERLSREVLASFRRQRGEDHPATLAARLSLANTLAAQRRREEAEELFRSTLDTARRTLGDEHPTTLGAMAELGQTLQDRGRFAEAEALFRKGLEAERRVHGDRHPRAAYVADKLAGLLLATGRQAEAIPLAQDAVAIRTRAFGADHARTADSAFTLGRAFLESGKIPEAEAAFRDVVAARRKGSKVTNEDLVFPLTLYGVTLTMRKKYAEGEAVLREGLKRREQSALPEHWSRPNSQSLLGECLFGQGKFAEAEPLLLAGEAGLGEWLKTHEIPKDLPANFLPTRLTEARQRLAALYEAIGKPDQAAKWRTDAKPWR